MTQSARFMPRARFVSRIAAAGAACVWLSSTALSAATIDMPLLRPAPADYAKICVPSAKTPVPQGVDWSRWSPGPKSPSAAEALAFARETMSSRASDDDNEIARKVLEAIVKGAPSERPAALYELAAADVESEAGADKRTVERLRRALALGYRRAAMLLGPIYEKGFAGQKPDIAHAELFYKLAVQARLEGGALRLAHLAMDRRKPDEARQWITLAQQMMGARLASGDCSQLSAIASLYLDGRVVPRSPAAAAEWLEAAHAAGDPKGSRLLAEMLLSGDGLPKDVDRGLGLLQTASERGDVAATVALGRWFRGDYGATPDPARALAMFEKAAAFEPPDATALIELGRAYRDGLGVQADAVAAERVFERASQLGSLSAKRELAGLAFSSDPPQVKRALALLREAANGRDVASAAMLGRWLLGHSFAPEEIAEGLRWLETAADQGHLSSIKVMARYYADRLDYARAADYWTRAVDADDPEALVELATLKYRNLIPAEGDSPDQLIERALASSETQPWGFVAVGRAVKYGRIGKPDAAGAFALFQKAAERMDPTGLRETGEALAVGDGTERDPAEAKRLLEQAAGMGDPGASITLARGIAAGWFGEPNPDLARQVLEAAAIAGAAAAYVELGALYSRGAFGDVDPEAAVGWWEKAAMAGDAEGMRELANAHSIGFGTDLNLPLALSWLERAAGRGDDDAMRRLAYVYHAGVGVEPDQAKAEHWATMARFSGPLPDVATRARP